MNTSEMPRTPETSLTQDVVSALRYYLGGRRGVIVLAVVTVGAGLALSWGWLAAIGVAPLLLALAPCAAMCALGLCMNKGAGKSCSTTAESGDQNRGPAISGPRVTDGPAAAADMSTANSGRHEHVRHPGTKP